MAPFPTVDLIEDLLPGLDVYLRYTLGAESLSIHADKHRKYFFNLIDFYRTTDAHKTHKDGTFQSRHLDSPEEEPRSRLSLAEERSRDAETSFGDNRPNRFGRLPPPVLPKPVRIKHSRARTSDVISDVRTRDPRSSSPQPSRRHVSRDCRSISPLGYHGNKISPPPIAPKPVRCLNCGARNHGLHVSVQDKQSQVAIETSDVTTCTGVIIQYDVITQTSQSYKACASTQTNYVHFSNDVIKDTGDVIVRRNDVTSTHVQTDLSFLGLEDMVDSLIEFNFDSRSPAVKESRSSEGQGQFSLDTVETASQTDSRTFDEASSQTTEESHEASSSRVESLEASSQTEESRITISDSLTNIRSDVHQSSEISVSDSQIPVLQIPEPEPCEWVVCESCDEKFSRTVGDLCTECETCLVLELTSGLQEDESDSDSDPPFQNILISPKLLSPVTSSRGHCDVIDNDADADEFGYQYIEYNENNNESVKINIRDNVYADMKLFTGEEDLPPKLPERPSFLKMNRPGNHGNCSSRSEESLLKSPVALAARKKSPVALATRKKSPVAMVTVTMDYDDDDDDEIPPPLPPRKVAPPAREGYGAGSKGQNMTDIGGYVNRGADVEMDARPDDVHFSMDQKEPQSTKSNSTKCKACHIVILFLLVIAVIVLAVAVYTRGFGSWLEEKENGREVCDSQPCAEASARISYRLDETADPCEDFYQYSCGGYAKKNVIPSSDYRKGTWSELPAELNIKMKALLESKSKLDGLSSIKQAKIYYQSCMNETAVEEKGTQPLKDLVLGNGGWGPLGTSWNEANFNLEDYMIKWDQFGQSLIIWGPTLNPFSVTERVVGIGRAKMIGSTLPQLYSVPQLFQTLLAFLLALFKALGIDDAVRQTEIPRMLDFEVELAKIFSADALPSPDQAMTMEELGTQVPGIDILKILNGGLAPYQLTKVSRVIVRDLEYLKKLSDLLGKTDKRTVATFILYSGIRDYVSNLNKATRSLADDLLKLLAGTAEEPERYVVCTALVNKDLPFHLSRLYIDEFYDGGTTEIERMTVHIEEVFKKQLNEVDWLSGSTRQKAKTKAEAMLLKLAYPAKVMNNDKLDEDYETLDFDPTDYFGNAIKMRKLVNSAVGAEASKPHDRTEWTSATPLTANAFYSPSENAFIVPLGILQPPFFHANGPRSLNYGALGFLIGHEITHGFDSNGRHFDKEGSLAEWMSQTSIDKFKQKTQCIQEQFSQLTVEQLGTKVNGQITLSENIADAGAIKQAFQAYQEWVQENGPEKSVPGLTFSPDKLFFIGFAQSWCEIITNQALVLLQTDSHTPNKERVLGVLMNSKDFSKTFNCRAGSRYNPPNKCSVW